MTDSYLAPPRAPRQLDIIDDTVLQDAPENKPELSTRPKTRNKPELSTTAEFKTKPELSIARAKRIETRRKELGISVSKLVFAANVSKDTYLAARLGSCKTRQSTFDALERALNRFGPGNAPPKKLTLYESYLTGLVTQIATRVGWDPELMLAQKFEAENTNDPIWLQASRLRRCAIYLMVEGLRCSKADIGRLIGVSRQAVHKSVAAIETERDRDQTFHAFMGTMMVHVSGQRL